MLLKILQSHGVDKVKIGTRHGVKQFLKDYPGMSLSPSRKTEMVLTGSFSFSVKSNEADIISNTYDVKIIVPFAFPKEIPTVIEAGKIPRNGEFHVNPDGTLCMGSPLRLLQILSEKPTLPGFAESCLVPYLYAVSYKLKHGGGFIFSELKHGTPGIIEDYQNLFGLQNKEQVIQALELLGKKQRSANKGLCPCGCGNRLGKCQFRFKLKKYKNIAKRSWFREHAKEIKTGMSTT